MPSLSLSLTMQTDLFSSSWERRKAVKINKCKNSRQCCRVEKRLVGSWLRVGYKGEQLTLGVREHVLDSHCCHVRLSKFIEPWTLFHGSKINCNKA